MAAKKSNSSKKATKKPSQKNTQTSSKKSTPAKATQPQGMNPQVKAILLFAAGVLFLALLLIRGASLWYMIRSFVFGLFGFCAILLPFVFFYMGIMTAKEKQMSHAGWKVFLAVLTVVMTCTLFYLFGRVDYNSMDYFSALKSAYLDSSADVRVSLCGLVGALLGYPMTALFTRTPSVVVCFVVLIVSVMILTGISLVDIANVAKKGYDRHVENRAQRRQRREQALEEIADEVEVVDDRYTVPEPASRGADDTRIDIPLDKPRRASKKKSPEALSDDIRDQEIIDIINNANAGVNFEANDEHMSASEVARQISRQKTSRRVSDGAKQPDPGTAEDEPAAPTGRDSDEEPFEKEVRKAAAEHPPAYTYPPIRLLDPPIDSENLSAYQEMQNNATKLIETLGSFGVKASIVDICRGPSVTRYELQPAAGVKISKITNLADDIALNLAANGVRIEAPIPGKAAVGIEVPNKVTSMVTLRELIDTDAFRDSESKLNCVLGRDISGELVMTDLSAMPHLLIAGTTGSGKSVCVNALLMSILFKASPDEVKLLLIDPKLVEFSKYKGIPHLLVPVVSDAKKAAGALNWAVSEMLSRYRIFAEYDCKDINSYNQLIDRNLAYIAEHRELNPPAAESDGSAEEPCLEIDGLKVPTEHMSRIVIAIDELADLMMAAPAEVEEAICRLAQMARAAGMHLIIATQRPSVNVITGVIKANIPSRIALKVSSNIDSRTILDAGGAEKLIGRGDMLYSPVGAPKPIRVQCCFAKDEEIERVTSFIKKKHRADYNQEVEEKIRRIAAEEMNGKGKDSSADNGAAPEVDALMEEAIKVVIEAGQASTSLLQRRMKVGYARAGRMIDDMEQMGIVGPHQGSKPRDVLMTYNEWLERSNLLGSPDTEPYADEEDAPWGT